MVTIKTSSAKKFFRVVLKALLKISGGIEGKHVCKCVRSSATGQIFCSSKKKAGRSLHH